MKEDLIFKQIRNLNENRATLKLCCVFNVIILHAIAFLLGYKKRIFYYHGKNNFAEISKSLTKYRSENNFESLK